MGRLRWTVRQYYTSSPYEFHAACEGYFDERKELRDVIRFASYRIAEHFVGSKAVGAIERYWPTDESKPAKIRIPSVEERRAILNRFKKKPIKQTES